MIIFKKFAMFFLIMSLIFITQCNEEHKCELTGKVYDDYTDIDTDLIVGQVVSNHWNQNYGVFSAGKKDDDNLWYIFFSFRTKNSKNDKIVLDTLIIDMTQYNKNKLVLNFMDCNYKDYNYNIVAIYDRYSRSSVRTIAKAWAADTKKKRFVELDPDSVTCMSEYELYGDES